MRVSLLYPDKEAQLGLFQNYINKPYKSLGVYIPPLLFVKRFQSKLNRDLTYILTYMYQDWNL